MLCENCTARSGSVFFFQAEDGIRDLTVTGVQTCALPISRAGPRRGPGEGARTVPERGLRQGAGVVPPAHLRAGPQPAGDGRGAIPYGRVLLPDGGPRAGGPRVPPGRGPIRDE